MQLCICVAKSINFNEQYNLKLGENIIQKNLFSGVYMNKNNALKITINLAM